VSVGGELQSSTSLSTHTWIPFSSAQANTEIVRHEDMLNTVKEFSNSNSQHSLAHHRCIYDEDDEVIQYDHWDEVWQKNDKDTENKEDFIEMIVSKTNSDDLLFKMEIRALLEEYRDLFSRHLNAIPADLPPLELDVDKDRFFTRTNQGPPRIMTVKKERHMRKFIQEGLE